MEEKRSRRTPVSASGAITRRLALRRAGATGLAAGLLAATASSDASAQSSLVSATTEAAARRAINAINRAIETGDMTLLDRAFAPDYVNHTPHRSLRTGQLLTPDLAGLEEGLIEVRAVVPNAVLIVDDVVASGDTAAVRATFRGTIDPAVIPLPEGASPRLSIGGMAFMRIVDGLVVESWQYDEAAEVLEALMKPPPEPTPEPTEAPATPGEVREVSDFSEVALEGVGTLIIEQGDTESLTIEAEDRVLRRIESEVQGGRLTIRPARSFNTREPIIYHLRVDDLTGIALSGAGSIEAQQLTTERLTLSLDGAGSLTIGDLSANVLEVTASGNGAVTLGGAVAEQSVSLTGTATFDAANLESQAATVVIDQAAQATVRVSDTLTASVGGAGRLQYIGNPDVRQEVSAAGSITQAG